MPDEPRSPNAGEPTSPQPAGMPTWAKVFLIVLVVVILAFVISLLAGVRHGPGLHSPDSVGTQGSAIEQST